MSDQVGLREMRQQAPELVRRVEAGEEIVVTVAGRPATRLVPARPLRGVRVARSDMSSRRRPTRSDLSNTPTGPTC
ncbi:MAG: type II toxin-antitoxin system prevent-host-death family antitoxin [Acidimicrobiia bacterium]|nr:type II toxin-antitoxin system prevent-host-death family antitoxin [Acidimicrobiia bacterium]